MLYVPIPFDVEGMLNIITSPSSPFNVMCLVDLYCAWSGHTFSLEPVHVLSASHLDSPAH